MNTLYQKKIIRKYKGDLKMAMTMTQKILAAHAGLESVSAGQLILASNRTDICSLENLNSEMLRK